MLSAMGLPLTGGFLGKFYVFAAAYEAGWWWLIVAGVIATAISLYYYLGVDPGAVHARGRPSCSRRSRAARRRATRCSSTAVFGSLVVTVGSFFSVQPLIELAEKAAATLPL